MGGHGEGVLDCCGGGRCRGSSAGCGGGSGCGGCEGEEEDWGEEKRGQGGGRGDGGGCGCGCEEEEEDCRGGRRGRGVTEGGGGRKEGVGENWELNQKRLKSKLKVTELMRRTVRFPQVVVLRRTQLAQDQSECGRAWAFA